MRRQATGASQVGCRAGARRVQPMVKMKPASSPRAAPPHPAEDRCRAEARRVQSMVKMKPASSPRASSRQPAEDRCRAGARRVQSMVKMKPASSPRAAPRHPAEDRCRAEARRVQSMVKMKPASSPRAAPRHPAGGRCRAEARRVQSMVKMNVRLRGPVFSALCHFRSAAGKTVGLVARDVKQSMSVVETSRKSVGKEAPASRKGRLSAAAVDVRRRVVEEVRSSGRRRLPAAGASWAQQQSRKSACVGLFFPRFAIFALQRARRSAS